MAQITGKVTIREVARQANVSISTVSRYMDDPTRVRPAAARAVREAIDSLGFVPNPFAQGLKKDASHVIRVIIPDISNSFFGIACKAMSRFFYDNGYSIVTCDTDENIDKERYYLDDALQSRAAGVLLASAGGNAPYIRQVAAKYPRIVLFDRSEDMLPIDCVCENNELSAARLTQRMLDAGQRRFAVLLGKERSINTMTRLRGIGAIAQQAGCPLEQRYVYANLDSKVDAYQAVQKLLEEEDAPRCVIACNPKLLEGAVFALNAGGEEKQKRVKLCGFSIEEPQNVATFPLCAVVQNPTAVALRASEMLLNRVNGGQTAESCEKILIEANICERT